MTHCQSKGSSAPLRNMQAVMSGTREHPTKEQLQDAVSRIIPRLTRTQPPDLSLQSEGCKP